MKTVIVTIRLKYNDERYRSPETWDWRSLLDMHHIDEDVEMVSIHDIEEESDGK